MVRGPDFRTEKGHKGKEGNGEKKGDRRKRNEGERNGPRGWKGTRFYTPTLERFRL